MKKLSFLLILKLLFWLTLSGIGYGQKMIITPYYNQPIPLYQSCGNEVAINIENYPYLENIRFEVEGGELIKGQLANILTIIPKDKEVIIKAFEGEKLISESRHRVVLLPLPTINVFFDGFAFNPRQVYTKEHLDSLYVRIFIQPQIAERIPKDMRYKVADLEIVLLRGTQVVSELLVQNEFVDLRELLKSAQVGDFLSVEVKNIKRMNFRGEIEVISFDQSLFTIQIH
ncbi:MAG: hypothetical protein MUE81_06620 [Thermoflexibacter sp.]|nr:hypothetical protein [Thermoflexibacter sp.]